MGVRRPVYVGWGEGRAGGWGLGVLFKLGGSGESWVGVHFIHTMSIIYIHIIKTFFLAKRQFQGSDIVEGPPSSIKHKRLRKSCSFTM